MLQKEFTRSFWIHLAAKSELCQMIADAANRHVRSFVSSELVLLHAPPVADYARQKRCNLQSKSNKYVTNTTMVT